jgi:unsaturated chondroitin disaccharide hydrolase
MTSTTWQDGLQRLLRRVDETGEGVTDGFPHYGDPATGQWTTSPGGDWTGSFWNGLCWLAAHRTSEACYRRWAQQWTERLRPRADSDTIFRGFLFYYGALLGSVCQSASFDQQTGQVVRRYTHKGIGDDSTWTRAQA